MKADTPITKLRNQTFFFIFGKIHLPSNPGDSTVRKNYVAVIYNEALSKIRGMIGSGLILDSVDETTDVNDRYFAYAIIEKLSCEPCKPFLINCGELKSSNNCKIF